ncbi:NAD(P)H-dependent flavin oxidoreductase [Streptomyces aquilus]|uniref:NAD(P)H-dependent flavin oxidoreductase n=1 Tax=Streptomyces aquilus TaxID=2548456 RepID=UPI00367CC3A8
MVAGGRSGREWPRRELDLAARLTGRPWGIGFLSWEVDLDTVAWTLEYRPAAVLLSFGDPAPFADRIRDAGARLMVQVTTLDEARRALDAGADFVVAQGGEAGGHGGLRATLPFVPAVADLAAPTPVLGAGGIADGRGLAAVLALGAAGAVIGTRFQASQEALVAPELMKRLLAAGSEDTERNRVLDIARGAPWPDHYTARTLRNAVIDRWRGREEELRQDAAARQAYRDAARGGALDVVPVWAGEALDLVTEVASATDLVTEIAERAEQALAAAGRG